MKRTILLLLFLSCYYNLNAQLTPPSGLQSYYSNVDFSLTGTQLLDDLAVETIAKHTNILQYTERHNYLYDADKDLSNSNNVILMYNGESRDKREYLSGNNSYSPQTFNTEHVYPQTFIGNTAKGDLHHLRSCDVSINSSRGSRPFANGSGNYGTVGTSWYPGDEWKGDVARMIFYLNLRYNESFSDVGSLNLFLQWNVDDPVSDFEKNRNEVIANAQGNRNPFIDNPFIATVIWGGTAAENTWSTLGTQNDFYNSLKIYPNPTFGKNLFIKTTEFCKVKIFDVLGKLIITDNIDADKSKIDISSLKKGIYIIKLFHNNNTISQKLIKR